MYCFSLLCPLSPPLSITHMCTRTRTSLWIYGLSLIHFCNQLQLLLSFLDAEIIVPNVASGNASPPARCAVTRRAVYQGALSRPPLAGPASLRVFLAPERHQPPQRMTVTPPRLGAPNALHHCTTLASRAHGWMNYEFMSINPPNFPRMGCSGLLGIMLLCICSYRASFGASFVTPSHDITASFQNVPVGDATLCSIQPRVWGSMSC